MENHAEREVKDTLLDMSGDNGYQHGRESREEDARSASSSKRSNSSSSKNSDSSRHKDNNKHSSRHKNNTKNSVSSGLNENFSSSRSDSGKHTRVTTQRLDSNTLSVSNDRSPEDPSEELALGSDAESDSGSGHSHEFDPNSCKGKTAALLKTNYVQYFIILLVILDCVIIVLELLIDMEILKRSLFKTLLPEDHHNATSQESHNASHLIAYGNVSHSLEDIGYNSSLSGNHSDDHEQPHHHTNKEKAEHILHACSLTILSIFMVEVSLKIFIEGKHLLKQKAEVFDAIVVIVSFTLDILFSFVSVTSAAKDAAGLMVVLRLWRVTRIINGVILSVKMEAKKKMDAQKKIMRKVEKENRKLKSRISKLEKENNALKNKLFANDSGSLPNSFLLMNKNNSFAESSNTGQENIEMDDLREKIK